MTVPSMNRLNQTEPATFQFCRAGLSLGILIFSILENVYTLYYSNNSRVVRYANLKENNV
jgi:hypothetical protein